MVKLILKEPASYIWEHMNISSIKRLIHRMISSVGSLILLAISFAIIFGLSLI